jgi:hypothetical protein
LIITRGAIVDDKGAANRDLLKWFQQADKKINASLTLLGIDPNATVDGRNGTIGSTLQHISPNGMVMPGGVGFTLGQVPGSIGSSQVGFTLDNVPDGTLRFAVAQVDGAKLAIIDLASAHLNKILDNVDDGVTYQRFARVATGQLALPTGLIAIGTSSTSTAAAPGVLTSDSVEWALVGGPASGYSSLTIVPYVTPGAVNFNVSNPSVTLGVSPGAQMVNYTVIR